MQIYHKGENTELDPGQTFHILGKLWEELLLKHGACWGKVASDSMYPLIGKGDQILVERSTWKQVRFADIIVFRRNEQLVTHRVLGKRKFNNERYFLEKGDAILESSLIPEGTLVGRVAAIKNSQRLIHPISGLGRLLQLALAGTSYSSLRLATVMHFCLGWRKNTANRNHYGAVYNSFFSMVRRATIRLLR